MVRFGSFPFQIQSPNFTQLRTEVDRLMEDFLGRQGGGRNYPAVNLWEGEQELVAEAELPGFKREELDITVVGNELTIKGTRVDTDEAGVTYHRRERGKGEFARVLKLPVEIAADKVEASFHDGVLRIRLPKAEAVLPKKIQINVTG